MSESVAPGSSPASRDDSLNLHRASGQPPTSPYPPRTYSLGEHVRCLVRPEILVVIPIYCLGLIPATVIFGKMVVRLEQALGIPSLCTWLSFETRVTVFAACLFVGAAIISFSYTWLVLEGGGGPVPPFSKRTRYLVVTGPYAVVRHPSLWGKLLGVIGLGIFLGSITFLTVVIPRALSWSLSSNTRRQDDALERAFGDAYLNWRDRTPRLVPTTVRAVFHSLCGGCQ